MDRCLQCNSTLKPDEKECWGCGTAVPEKNPKTSMIERFRTVSGFLLIVFAVLTVASLFTNYVPSFWKCFAGLLIIYLVRNSAIQMVDAKKSD